MSPPKVTTDTSVTRLMAEMEAAAAGAEEEPLGVLAAFEAGEPVTKLAKELVERDRALERVSNAHTASLCCSVLLCTVALCCQPKHQVMDQNLLWSLAQEADAQEHPLRGVHHLPLLDTQLAQQQLRGLGLWVHSLAVGTLSARRVGIPGGVYLDPYLIDHRRRLRRC